MKLVKKMLAVLLAVMLMVPSMMVGAAETANSPALKDISDAEITIKNFEYTGEMKAPSYTITYNGTKLVRGTDYEMKNLTHKNCGTYKVTFIGMGTFTGSKVVSYEIKKAKNTVPLKQTKTVSYSKVKKGDVTFTMKQGIGKITNYSIVVKKAKNKKYIKVNNKSGKIRVKKGAVKGTYRVKIRYAGNKNHYPRTTTIAVVVK